MKSVPSQEERLWPNAASSHANTLCSTVSRSALLLLETEVLPSPREVVRSRRISSKKLKIKISSKKLKKKNITDISKYTSSTYVC